MGHTKDVLSVAFSGDNRQIISASRDKTIKLWNTLGQCKYTITVTLKFLGVSLKIINVYVNVAIDSLNLVTNASLNVIRM